MRAPGSTVVRIPALTLLCQTCNAREVRGNTTGSGLRCVGLARKRGTVHNYVERLGAWSRSGRTQARNRGTQQNALRARETSGAERFWEAASYVLLQELGGRR